MGGALRCRRSGGLQGPGCLYVVQLRPNAALRGCVARPLRGRQVVVEKILDFALILPQLGNVRVQGDVKQRGAVLGGERRGRGQGNAQLLKHATLVNRAGSAPLTAAVSLIGRHVLLGNDGPVLAGYNVHHPGLLALEARRPRGTSATTATTYLHLHVIQLKPTPLLILIPCVHASTRLRHNKKKFFPFFFFFFFFGPSPTKLQLRDFSSLLQCQALGTDRARAISLSVGLGMLVACLFYNTSVPSSACPPPPLLPSPPPPPEPAAHAPPSPPPAAALRHFALGLFPLVTQDG